MDSPVTLRLDQKTRDRLARIAERKQTSVSEVIREAIGAWAETQEAAVAPHEIASDLIGVVKGGKPGRSTQTGRQLRELLKSRKKRS